MVRRLASGNKASAQIGRQRTNDEPTVTSATRACCKASASNSRPMLMS